MLIRPTALILKQIFFWNWLVVARLEMIITAWKQEPITRSVQLPYSVCETAFSQVRLFLDAPFPRISFQKPIKSGA